MLEEPEVCGRYSRGVYLQERLTEAEAVAAREEVPPAEGPAPQGRTRGAELLGVAHEHDGLPSEARLGGEDPEEEFHETDPEGEQGVGHERQEEA